MSFEILEPQIKSKLFEQPLQHLKAFFELLKKLEQEYRSNRSWNPNDNQRDLHSLRPLKLPISNNNQNFVF